MRLTRGDVVGLLDVGGRGVGLFTAATSRVEVGMCILLNQMENFGEVDSRSGVVVRAVVVVVGWGI